MKWGEFKKMAEEAGITDDQEIEYIDISYPIEGRVDFFPAGDGGGLVIQ